MGTEVIVRVPQFPESIKEGTLAKILKAQGGAVGKDEPLAVIETEKVSIDVNSPVAGQIKKLWRKEEDVVKSGDELFTVESSDSAAAVAANASSSPPGPPSKSSTIPSSPSYSASASSSPVSATSGAAVAAVTAANASFSHGARKPLIQFRHGGGRNLTSQHAGAKSTSAAPAVFGSGLRDAVDNIVTEDQLPAKYRRKPIPKEVIQLIELGGAM